MLDAFIESIIVFHYSSHRRQNSTRCCCAIKFLLVRRFLAFAEREGKEFNSKVGVEQMSFISFLFLYNLVLATLKVFLSLSFSQ